MFFSKEKSTHTNAIRPVARRLAALCAPMLLLPGFAAAATTYTQAPVVNVEPQYEQVTYRVPVEACVQREVPVRRHYAGQSRTAPILGAIIGGAIGNAMGHEKRNKQVGAVVGAVLGGSIGADIARKNRHSHDVSYRTREVCETSYEVREDERLTGYKVDYLYDGTTYTTHMDRDPGEYLRVRVRVTPAE